DSNVVNVAIPSIASDLHGTLTSVQWTVSGYLLALGAALPATSYLVKRFGTVRIYAISLAAFTIASAACAFATTVPELVAFRALQGVAAAPLVPLAMNLLFGQAGAGDGGFPVAAGLALFLGPALGPTVGGLLVAAWGWPSIFLINAPIGVLALAALPMLRRRGILDSLDASARFDPFGLVLLSAGLVGTLYGTSEGPSEGWFSARAWPYWSTGLVLVGAYVLWACRRPHPAVNLRLLHRPQSALAVWLCTITSVALFSVLFLLPLLVQDIQGHGPLASGLVLLPQGIVMGVSTKLGDLLRPRGLVRTGIIVGLAAIAVTTASLLLIQLDTPLWLVALLMAGRGLGIGLVIQPLLTTVLAGLPGDDLADANTLFNVGQRLGGSIGVSLLATYFTLRVTAHVQPVLAAAGITSSSGSVGSIASAPAALREPLANAALHGFRDAIGVAVVIAVVGALFALFLDRDPAPPTPADTPPASVEAAA
ncbi:MAG TPA: DHA2 family efflux MFS transporter permease subunit, partial [Micromonosporaceae bacterium]